MEGERGLADFRENVYHKQRRGKGTGDYVRENQADQKGAGA